MFPNSFPYFTEVKEQIHEAGYYVDVDISDKTVNKKVWEAQDKQYNYILVVGKEEIENRMVSVRVRDEKNFSVFSV
ncbi:hypothetical protein AgCh_013425 [Apium graveolens]